MANRLFTRIFGTRFDRELKRIQPIVDAIKQHEVHLKDFSDSELQVQTVKFRERIAERTGALQAEVERIKKEKHDSPDPEKRADLGTQLARAEETFVKELQRTLDDLLPEAFATVREASRRLLGSEVVVTGRAKDLIIVNGFNVYPSEVEAVLYMHPAVRLAAVVGVIAWLRGRMDPDNVTYTDVAGALTLIGDVVKGYAAVALARKIFGDLSGRTVVVLGAGEMGKLTAIHMKSQAVRHITIVSRTMAHAARTAEAIGGRPASRAHGQIRRCTRLPQSQGCQIHDADRATAERTWQLLQADRMGFQGGATLRLRA